MSKQTFQITGLHCADCVTTVENGVRQVPGVREVRLNFADQTLSVEGDAEAQAVTARVTALGYGVQAEPTPAAVGRMGLAAFLLSSPVTRLALVGGGLLLAGWLLGTAGAPRALTVVLQIAALGLAGWPVARSGVVNLVVNRDFNINLLTTLAALGAVWIGELGEAATLIFLFAISEALEEYNTDRARRVLGELSQLAPDTALRLIGTETEKVPAAALQPGERVLVQPGERIPADGVVALGESEVNQAPITGESRLVEKRAGDEVFAGTLNGSGALHVQVSRTAGESTLSRIVKMVSDAQALRAPSQRMVDRFARVYTPAVTVLALLVAALPPLLWGAPFFDLADGTRGWLYRALTLLVISCPCALVISTPVTVLSALSAAARRGVLVKGGAFLEALAQVRLFAFDKTGTLTYGRPQVTQARAVDCEGSADCARCGEVLALACALERSSAHPLAQAVVAAAETRGLAQAYAAAEGVTAMAGMGLRGQVNGATAVIGSHRLFDAHYPHPAALCDWVLSAETAGETAMLVSDGQAVRGVITASDQIRPEAADVAAALHALGLHTAVLTGDNPAAAQRSAQAAGIETVRAGLLPEEKLEALRELQASFGPAAMVGDGINDTPALAAASVGVAMGGAGSAQALETADIVLMADSLEQLPFVTRLAHFTLRLIRQNIAFSLLTKLGLMGVALLGWAPMWLAVVGDMGISLAVTANGMRAARFESQKSV